MYVEYALEVQGLWSSHTATCISVTQLSVWCALKQNSILMQYLA